MEIRQLVRNSTNKVTRATLPKGHMNGVVCVVNLDDDVNFESYAEAFARGNIRAKFVHDKIEYLNTNTPLNAMIALSDLNHGSIGSLSRLFQNGFLNQANNGQNIILSRDFEEESETDPREDAVQTSVQYPYLNNSYTFFVDYGSIYCEDGNEFEMELELGALEGIQGVSVYSVSKDLDPFHFVKYDIDFDLNEEHKSLMKGFIFTETLEKDANVVVTADSRQYDSDLEGFRASSQIFGEIENASTGILYEVFSSAFGVPEDVWIRLTRNGSVALNRGDSRLGIFTQRLEFPIQLATDRDIRTLEEKYQIVSKFEANHPEQAISMIATGSMDSAKDIMEEIRFLKSGRITAPSSFIQSRKL